MPFREPIFEAGGFYHIYNRGIRKMKIYSSEYDYERFEKKLTKLLDKNSDFRLHGYCLMPNHFHLILEQQTELGPSKFLGALQSSYAKYFNLKRKRKGNVYEGRFQAKRVESDEYLLQLVKYIHRNPLVAGLVDNNGTYPWSSHSSYISQISKPFVTYDYVLGYFESTKRARQAFKSFVDEDLTDLAQYQIKDLIIESD